MTYTVIDTGTTAFPDSSIFSIVSTTTLQIQTNDATKSGNSYTIQVTGHQSYSPYS